MCLKNLITDVFKISCVLVVAFMIAYWLYKYQKDDDLTLIEFKQLNEIKNVIQPEMSICVWYPFLNQELLQTLNVTEDETLHKKYFEFLKGNYYDESFQNISYDQVSPKLWNHLQFVQIYWRSNEAQARENCTVPKDCPYFSFKNNYNGILHSQFLKCFGVRVKKEYAKDIEAFMLTFKQSLARDLIQNKGTTERQYVFAIFRYPNQLLVNFGGSTVIWRKRANKNQVDIFHITSATIFTKRNKRNDPCLNEWMHYDDLKLTRHIENVGCRAPYQKKHNDITVCSTQDELKKALFDGWLRKDKYVLSPCQEMPKIGYKHTFALIDNLEKNHTQMDRVYVSYPDKMTIITQTQAVDCHSLIGNIGGYIGLFLGR